MALARTNLVGLETNIDVRTSVTGSFTPPANSLLVCSVGWFDDTDQLSTLAISDSAGLFWTQQAILRPDNGGLAPGSYPLQVMWTASVGPSPVSMTIQVQASVGSVNAHIIDFHVVAYTGYDPWNPIGATGTVVYPYNSQGINSSATLSLNADPINSSVVFASLYAGANSAAGPITQGAGWTEIYDWVGGNGAGLGFQSQERTGSTSRSVDWADVDTNNGSAGLWGNSGIALEIRASGAIAAGWPVTLDAVGTLSATATVATVSYTGITVGNGSERALLAFAFFGSTGSPVSRVFQWDALGAAPQTMTEIPGATATLAGGERVYVYALINPHPGNLTLKGTWTNSTQTNIFAISFNGVTQSSVLDAFKHWTFNSVASSSNPTQNVPADAPNFDMIVNAIAASSSTPSAPTLTQAVNGTVSTANHGAVQYGPATGSPMSVGWTLSAAIASGMTSIEVIPPGAVGGGWYAGPLERKLRQKPGSGPLSRQIMARAFDPPPVPVVVAVPATGSTLPMMGVG